MCVQQHVKGGLRKVLLAGRLIPAQQVYQLDGKVALVLDKDLAVALLLNQVADGPPLLVCRGPRSCTRPISMVGVQHGLYITDEL